MTIGTLASIAASTSASRIRHQPMVVSGRPASTMARLAAISSLPIAGVPASILVTPARASACAIATFSSVVKATPGACSPSRSVVSLSTIGLPHAVSDHDCLAEAASIMGGSLLALAKQGLSNAHATPAPATSRWTSAHFSAPAGLSQTRQWRSRRVRLRHGAMGWHQLRLRLRWMIRSTQETSWSGSGSAHSQAGDPHREYRAGYPRRADNNADAARCWCRTTIATHQDKSGATGRLG